MSETLAGIVKGIEKAKRITVIADGEDLSAGNVVKITGAEGSIPKAKKTVASWEVGLGVMYEDVKNGEKGLCIIDDAVVEVIAAGAISIGTYVCPDAGGKVSQFVTTPLTPAAAETVGKTQCIIGLAIQAASADGDKIQIILCHGICYDSSTGT